ncbi:hypothetical protein GBAR_LOCUS20336 [Geodia barretti]|uniref:Uncharacterized protein n=1 Tax=Geodia barretti TaxID=519541 RepID=A0AA35WWC0_GEOBA|nr:hypothetical protein GBAR_LOCUS20336 [Geodia barretti]
MDNEGICDALESAVKNLLELLYDNTSVLSVSKLEEGKDD